MGHRILHMVNNISERTVSLTAGDHVSLAPGYPVELHSCIYLVQCQGHCTVQDGMLHKLNNSDCKRLRSCQWLRWRRRGVALALCPTCAACVCSAVKCWSYHWIIGGNSFIRKHWFQYHFNFVKWVVSISLVNQSHHFNNPIIKCYAYQINVIFFIYYAYHHIIKF